MLTLLCYIHFALIASLLSADECCVDLGTEESSRPTFCWQPSARIDNASLSCLSPQPLQGKDTLRACSIFDDSSIPGCTSIRGSISFSIHNDSYLRHPSGIDDISSSLLSRDNVNRACFLWSELMLHHCCRYRRKSWYIHFLPDLQHAEWSEPQFQ